MSKLINKIKEKTTHKPVDSSETDSPKPAANVNDRSNEQPAQDTNTFESESQTQPQGASKEGGQPPLMSYDSTNNSGVCGARGGSQGKKSEEPVEEQRFSIQPHPARTNNPEDLQPGDEQDFMSPGGGACSARQQQQQPLAPGVFAMPGIAIPNNAQQQEVPPPSSRDELKARSAELNRPPASDSF